MSENTEFHPSAEDLIKYAEGQLIDARIVESHIDHCPECAEAILASRRIRFLAQHDRIPPLNESERSQEKDRLRKFLESGGLGKSFGGSENKASPTNRNATFWGTLGALGGALSLGNPSTGPVPTLAGSDSKPDTGVDPPGKPENSNESDPSAVTDSKDPTSNDHEPTKAPPNEVQELLDRMQGLLDPSHDESEDWERSHDTPTDTEDVSSTPDQRDDGVADPTSDGSSSDQTFYEQHDETTDHDDGNEHENHHDDNGE